MHETFTVEDITYTGGKKQTDGWGKDVQTFNSNHEKVAPEGNMTIEKLIKFYDENKHDKEFGKVYTATLYYLTDYMKK